jgi:hypothetical protein
MQTKLVILDRDGSVGAKVWGVFQSYIFQHEARDDARFELLGVRSSERARRKPLEYDLVRDELWMVFAQWLRDGGAIPEDARLAKDLHAPKWEPDMRNRAKATAKKELRKLLGRSPDRGDACVLSTWEPSTNEQADAEETRTVARQVYDDEDLGPTAMDPYAGVAAWSPRR